MRKVAGLLVLAWLIAGLAIELASYLPFDPEWTLLGPRCLRRRLSLERSAPT